MNKLSTNPIQDFYRNIYNLEYERGFKGKKTDYGASIFWGHTGSAPRLIDGYKTYVSEIDLSAKKYTESFSKSSFWYGMQISGASITMKEVNNNSKESLLGTLGLSVREGYQLIWKAFYLDCYGSLGYVITNNLFGNAIYSDDVRYSRWLVRWGIKTGIVF